VVVHSWRVGKNTEIIENLYRGKNTKRRGRPEKAEVWGGSTTIREHPNKKGLEGEEPRGG